MVKNKEKEPLEEAFSDLNNEVKHLHLAKSRLNGQLRSSASKIKSLKQQRIKLRDLILLSKEEEKKTIKMREKIKVMIDRMNKKIEKVKMVGERLKKI